MSTDGQTQLGLKLVGDIADAFFVPAHQRGYRWDREQVSLLITDIWDNQDKDYCLQPVVVKRLADDRLELIDGQQRLTTLCPYGRDGRWRQYRIGITSPSKSPGAAVAFWQQSTPGTT
ncbi:MAG: DUF262 domain-containing protein [Gemmatimonadaceae bacterium]